MAAPVASQPHFWSERWDVQCHDSGGGRPKAGSHDQALKRLVVRPFVD